MSLLEPIFVIILTVFLALFCYLVVWYLERGPIRREREEVQPPKREKIEDRFHRIDRLFDVILVLVTIVAAAELQYASVAFMENPDPNRTFIMKLNSLSFTFRILTIPIVILIFIWLGRAFFHNENRRMFMRELCWTFAMYILLLESIVFYTLSFAATIDLFWFVTGAVIPFYSVLIGLLVREYRRLAPDLEYLNWLGWMFWVGSTVAIFISWTAIQIVIFFAVILPTPIPL